MIYRTLGVMLLAWSCSDSVPSGATTPKVLRLVMASDPPQLNSLKSTDQVSGMVLGHTMEGLTRYGKNGEIIPGIAESWQLDGLHATFHLRHGALWGDNQPVTAEDFIFAWRTALEPATASEYAFILYPLRNAEAINAGKLPVSELGVSAPDPSTLEITLEKPCGYFLGLTAYPTYLPVRSDFYREKGERYAADANTLLSNGPFKIASWVHGASLRLDKNPSYWDAERIKIDRIDIPYMTADTNAAYNLFLDDKIDTIGIGKDNLPRAQADRLRMKSFADGSIWFMEFNFRPGRATANYHLRKAIQLAFDPKEFVSRVVAIPGTRPGLSIIPAWVPGVQGHFRAEYPLPAVKPDVQAARRELELARQELGGTVPPLVWLTGEAPASGQQAEYFQALFKSRLGIELKIDKQIFKQRLEKMLHGDFDIVDAGWGPDFADPMTFAELFASWNENNRGKYKSARYDELIRKAQSSSDQKTRMDAMAEAERVGLEDVAVVMTFERVLIYAHQPRVSGIVRHVVGPDPDFTWVTLDTDAEKE
jgi:oligopeptide transport system substrate-binding protein